MATQPPIRPVLPGRPYERRVPPLYDKRLHIAQQGFSLGGAVGGISFLATLPVGYNS
jgi:hypothetical protein